MLPDRIDTIVVGGGAAGMMAAVFAARAGEEVLLLEKNEKLGKKLYITGKGRCNFTNACAVEDIFTQVVTNAKFLYSSIYGFDNMAVVDFFEKNGLSCKTERGGRVFPASDKSSDVIRTLDGALKSAGVTVRPNTAVDDLLTERLPDDPSAGDNGHKKAKDTYKFRIVGVRCGSHKVYADRVILATGGLSYPSTGSTGDGYAMAKSLGHSIVKTYPALTGLTTKESWVRDVQGLTLINTDQRIYDRTKKSSKPVFSGFGELLFTHFGVSGPTMLRVSSKLGRELQDHPLELVLDLKPGLDRPSLDKRLLRELDANSKKSIQNTLRSMLPQSLIPVILKLSDIDENTRSCDINGKMRSDIADSMKELKLTLTGIRGFEEAVITKGGVDVKQIDPHTMQSRIVSGLYFAGEVMDVDAYTGGYNLQIAWSTGAAAGRAGKDD